MIFFAIGAGNGAVIAAFTTEYGYPFFCFAFGSIPPLLILTVTLFGSGESDESIILDDDFIRIGSCKFQ